MERPAAAAQTDVGEVAGRARPGRRAGRELGDVPSIGAATTCSIFIASSVTIGSPASTSCPAATWTARTEPGIGATSSTGTAGVRGGRPRGADRRPAAGPAGTRRCGRRRRRGRPRRRRPRTGSTAVPGRATPARRSAVPSSSVEAEGRGGVQPPAAEPRVRGESARRRRGRHAVVREARRSAQSSGGQIRSSVSIRASPVADRGLRTSQRRNRRFVDEPEDDRLVERGGQPIERRGAIRAVGDRSSPASGRTGDRDVALDDAGVDPDRRPGRPAQPLDPAGRRQEAVLGILGVEADLDGMAVRRDRRSRLSSPSGRPSAIASCCSTRSRPGDELGDRVLDLEPGVHLEEEGLAASSSRNSHVPALS